MTKLQELYGEYGQSPWLDNLTRAYLRDGTLARMVADGIRGVTANPTIFARSIEGRPATTTSSVRSSRPAARCPTPTGSSSWTTSSTPSPFSARRSMPAAGATASCRSRLRRSSPVIPRRRSLPPAEVGANAFLRTDVRRLGRAGYPEGSTAF
jgi:hypothetical protein